MALNKSLTTHNLGLATPAKEGPSPSLVVAGDGVVVLLALERRVRVVRPVAEALEVEELAAVGARRAAAPAPPTRRAPSGPSARAATSLNWAGEWPTEPRVRGGGDGRHLLGELDERLRVAAPERAQVHPRLPRRALADDVGDAEGSTHPVYGSV